MTKQEIQVKLGNRIIFLREKKEIKQYVLAEKIGIEDSALRRIERGKANCTLHTLYKISIALEISLPELLEFDDK
jgi:transcriptional regulator with XRE-family HTH domain